MVTEDEEGVDLFVMMVDNDGLRKDSTTKDDSDNSVNPPSLTYDNDNSSYIDSMPALEQHESALDNDERDSEWSDDSIPELIPQIDSDDDTVPEIPSGNLCAVFNDNSRNDDQLTKYGLSSCLRRTKTSYWNSFLGIS